MIHFKKKYYEKHIGDFDWDSFVYVINTSSLLHSKGGINDNCK
jgi:hypothetical protein